MRRVHRWFGGHSVGLRIFWWSGWAAVVIAVIW